MPPKNILIIDDEELLRGLFTMALRQEGYTVFQAGSAQEAIDLLQNSTCQVIFSDINLPDMDGIELCRQLCQDIPMVQIHAITGDINRLEERLSADSPFASHLGKPIEIAHLLATAATSFEQLQGWT